jgi:hypothetical protein
MKRFSAIISILFIVVSSANAQNRLQIKSGRDSLRSVRQDLLIMNFNWNGWMNQPDGMDVSPFSRGFEIKAMADFPLGKSNFSLAAGLGLSLENIFTNAFLKKELGVDSLYFSSINEVINPEANAANPRDWNRYKLATTIIELPIEVRFRANPRRRNTFKFTAGFKIGFVIDSHEKYVGPDYRFDSEGAQSNLSGNLTQITYDLPGINRLRYAAYGRVGYGRVALTFQYGIQPFFQSGWHVQEATPISVGISFIPF